MENIDTSEGYRAWILREDGNLALSSQQHAKGKVYAVEMADRQGSVRQVFMNRQDALALRAALDEALAEGD